MEERYYCDECGVEVEDMSDLTGGLCDECLKKYATVENAMKFSEFHYGNTWEDSFERDVFDDSEHMELMRKAVKETLAVGYAPTNEAIRKAAERYCLFDKDSFAEWLKQQNERLRDYQAETQQR